MYVNIKIITTYKMILDINTAHNNYCILLLYAYYLLNIYVCLPRGYVFWPIWYMVPPFIPMIHMICMHTKYQVLSTTYTNNILHINYPVTDSMTPNDRDNNIWYMCIISRLGYVSGTVCIDENGVYIVWFGTHITIN